MRTYLIKCESPITFFTPFSISNNLDDELLNNSQYQREFEANSGRNLP